MKKLLLLLALVLSCGLASFAETVTLTTDFLGMSGNSYKDYTKVDATSGLTFKVHAAVNGGIALNKNKAAYIVVSENKENVTITSITFNMNTKGNKYVYKVMKNDSPFTLPSAGTASGTATLNGTEVAEISKTTNSDGGKFEVNDSYVGLYQVSGNMCSFSSIVIAYEANTVTPANVVYNADFTVDEVFTFEQSGSYPWSWDKTYGLKGSAYVSGKANATDVVAASAVIDLTNRVAPIEFTINHALNQYKLNNVLINVAEVGEYAKIVARVEGETEWTEIAVPEVTKFSWTYFNQTINLDQFSGKKIQIGFRYISTAQIAGTWEIKTVTLTAPKGTPAPVAPAAPVVTMGEKTVTVTVEEGCTAYYKFVVVNDQPAIETFALEADTWYPVENNTIDLTKLPMTSGNEKLQLTVKAVNADNVESEVYTTEPFANPGGTTGIADIELGEEAPAEYYNLQGVRMEGELTPGLYIRRQGNKATKVIVK